MGLISEYCDNRDYSKFGTAHSKAGYFISSVNPINYRDILLSVKDFVYTLFFLWAFSLGA